MAPPAYGDLGKTCKDLFSKSFPFGHAKLDFKTSRVENFEVKLEGKHDFDSNKVAANLETTYEHKDRGITLKEKWSTANLINMEGSWEPSRVEGSKLTALGSFAPHTGKATFGGKASFKNDATNIYGKISNEKSAPIADAAGVFTYNDWTCGYHSMFNLSSHAFMANNFSLGFSTKGSNGATLEVLGQVNNGKDLSAHLYQGDGKKHFGCQFQWSVDTSDAKISAAFKNQLNKDISYKVKLDNSLNLGMSYTAKMCSGMDVTLGSRINLKNLNQGGHQLGVGLDLNL